MEDYRYWFFLRSICIDDLIYIDIDELNSVGDVNCFGSMRFDIANHNICISITCKI